MSIDRDDLTALIRTWTPYPGNESAAIQADAILALEQPDAPCDDLRARLANIAELRDEMRTAGGAVVWIDDLDTILDGAAPGAALTRDEVALVLGWAGTHGSAHGLTDTEAALAARLEGTP